VHRVYRERGAVSINNDHLGFVAAAAASNDATFDWTDGIPFHFIALQLWSRSSSSTTHSRILGQGCVTEMHKAARITSNRSDSGNYRAHLET
jgi:hypothetical protein